MIILCIGWIVARIASSVVRRGLSRTTLDERLAGVLFGQERAQGTDLAGGIGRGVYYVIMLFVLVAFFQALGLTLITEPLNSLLNQVFAFIPQLIGAGVLLLVAWIIATIMRKIVAKGLATSNIDQRLGDEESGPVPISKSVAEAVYWLIFLLFLPAILGSLELGGLLAPVQGMLDKILGFLPNILTAGFLLLIGWFVARLVQRIVTSLLAAVGLDRVSERVGLAPALGELQLSGILGMIVYIFILLPVVISALNALSLDAVAQPASDMLKQILSAIPAIFAAVLVVGVAYVIGRLVGGLIGNLLAGIGFDNILSKLGLGELGADKRQPSAIVGSLVMVVIIFFAAMEAFGMLGFTAAQEMLSFFLVFAGHILFGLVILAIGLYLANLVARGVQGTGTAHAALLSTVSRVAILVLVGAMALRQMGLAHEIVNLAFGLLLGALAVAVALAFGLGGREAAARQLEQWREKAQADE